MFKPIKFNMGHFTNNVTGERTDIVVSTLAPNNLRDILIGGAITFAGICWLTVTAFKKGCHTYEDAAFETCEKIGVIHVEDDPDANVNKSVRQV